jgi:methionyl-tRNA synthetase
MNEKNFYITTTLPYVNAEPHIGFALEIVQADVIARYQAALGKKVVFNFGTDEHGVKIYRKAEQEGKDAQAYVDEYAAKFDELKKALNLSYTHFIRTTSLGHKAAAQEFWKRCLANGDIYKKQYKIKYCVGCELEKTDSELQDGKCLIHPNLEIELIDEENYFFKFSNYQQKLLGFYESHPDFVVPEGKFNEIKAFVKEGLQDFSISRLKSKMPWGVDIPGDSEQVMYVWFDALVSYISTLGWPKNEKDFNDFWPGIQLAGKDNLRQQSAIWQAMLFSAGLPNSKQIFIHGHILANGEKMSKSLGNVISPFEMVQKYGTDAVRHFLIQHIHPFEDSDFTIERFEERYNSDLANGLGNLVARVVKLAETHLQEDIEKELLNKEDEKYKKDYVEAINNFRLDQASDYVFKEISRINENISNEKPFDKQKTEEERKILIKKYIQEIYKIAELLEPFMPETAEKIEQCLKAKKPIILFARLEKKP